MTGPAVEWFTRTGHCHGCGQPGNFCLCRDSEPCGCRAYHPMGSGREPDALGQFVEAPPDQDGLFDA